MKTALVKAGIPEADITLDYAGFRTLDSVVRAKEIFGQEDGFTIISQPFHVERALFLANAHKIKAI
jgi:SanA protein